MKWILHQLMPKLSETLLVHVKMVVVTPNIPRWWNAQEWMIQLYISCNLYITSCNHKSCQFFAKMYCLQCQWYLQNTQFYCMMSFIKAIKFLNISNCISFFLSRFTLQRNLSSVSQTSTEPDDSGQKDDKPNVTRATGRISAKQRR